LVALAYALKFSDLAGVSPVEKVLELLEDLKTTVQEEGAAESDTYDKLACFCKDNQMEKQAAIEQGETDAATLEADIKALNAEIEQLSATIKETTEKIATTEKALADMTAVREKEHAVYEVEFADASAAVNAIVKAIGHLEDSKTAGLTEVQSEVQQTMSMADALGMEVTNQPAVTSFLQQTPEKFAGKGEYEFKSGGIIDVLKDLQAKFQARKDDLDKEEDAALKSFEAAAAAMREEIDAAKTELESAEEQLATAQSDLATKTETLTETKATLNDDNMYLKDITGQCETKAKEWDQRSQARAGEIAAVSKAIEIIGGTVADKAASSGAGGRTEPEAAGPATEEGPMVEKMPTKLLQVPVSGGVEEYRDVVFLQVGQVQKSKAKEAELRNKAITMISKIAKENKSLALSVLAMKLARDPFAKVKTLIQQLIERLLTEAKNEATHKGWCDTEMGKAKKDREHRHGATVTLNAQIADNEAFIAKLKEMIDTLTTGIDELNTSLLEATENREEDKANNKKTMKDAKEGLDALKEAIKVLKDYYMGAKKSANAYEGGGYEGMGFVQASPVTQDMAAGGVEGGEIGAYKGNTAQGEGIIGMLETIKSDFERTLKNTEKEEYDASRDFATFSQETKVSIQSKTTERKNAQYDLERTSGDLVAALGDLEETQKQLDLSLEALEKLRPACVDTGMTYEERVEAREAEIDALKNALCVLDEEDGEYEECGGKLFLQKK
jgi:chromosome segregation ATPase